MELRTVLTKASNSEGIGMNHNSDWEYRLYFNEWMRQQKFEQDRQDAIWQCAKDYPPKSKGTPLKGNQTPAHPTDIIFGFLLLTGSGWLGIKAYQQTSSTLFAFGVMLFTVFIADAAYRYTPLGFLMRWIIRLGIIALIAIAIIGTCI